MLLSSGAKVLCIEHLKKSDYILHRALATVLHRAAHMDAPVLLEGPRGSGKTWLLQNEFPRRPYVSLDDPPQRRSARRDPATFLARFRGAAIIDDAHRAPELIALLTRADESRPVILASSCKLSLPFTTLRLFHPTRAEREGRPPLAPETIGRFVPERRGMPQRTVAWPRDTSRLERDIQELVQIRDLDRFDAFLQIAREHSGQVLDHAKLARLAGTSRTTVVRWLAVLDACFLTIRLNSSEDDFGRRLIRGPKLHFLDSNRFESAVVSEIYRNMEHAGRSPDLRYWRDSNGMEVSLLLRLPGSPPMPVSIVETPNPADYARLQRWMNLAGAQSSALISLHPPEFQRAQILRYTVDQL